MVSCYINLCTYTHIRYWLYMCMTMYSYVYGMAIYSGNNRDVNNLLNPLVQLVFLKVLVSGSIPEDFFDNKFQQIKQLTLCSNVNLLNKILQFCASFLPLIFYAVTQENVKIDRL